MTSTQPDGIAVLSARHEPPGTPEHGEAYVRTIATLRSFLDQLSAARIDMATVDQLDEDLAGWSDRLAGFEVPEPERMFGHWFDFPGRGQALVPELTIIEEDGDRVVATVRFSSFYLGRNGAAHGGAVALLFDDMLGHLSVAGGRTPSRTAFLKTDFRSITPVGTELTLCCWVQHVEGRKRFLSGTLHHSEVLCAEAEALLVELLPGQP